MASQLGRQYCPPPPLNQNGVPMTNIQTKPAEPVSSEGGRDLLVKQTYWEYDDFMNTNIRNPPKKCYYEMMSRDEYNTRKDLCTDLETRRNNIIEKIEKRNYASSEEVSPTYRVADSQNIRYNSPTQPPMPEMEQHLAAPNTPPSTPPPPPPPLPQTQYQPQSSPPLPPHSQSQVSSRTSGANRPVDRANSNTQQRQNQNPRPRSVPYHMQSPVNFQPRPGPGVQSQTTPPPNEASNVCYSYINLPPNTSAQRIKNLQNSASLSVPGQNSDVYTSNNNNSSSSNNINSNSTEKYYGPSSVRPKPVQRFPLPTGTTGLISRAGPHQFTPPQNSVRYQYSQNLAETAMQDSRQPPVSTHYEANNLQASGAAYQPSKLNCRTRYTSLSCSCSPQQDGRLPNNANNRHQTPQSVESDRQYKAVGLDNVEPPQAQPPPPLPPPQLQQQGQQYGLKGEILMERNQKLQACSPPPYGPEHQYGNRQQPMLRGGNMGLRSQYVGPKVISASTLAPPPLAINMRQRRSPNVNSNMMQQENLQYSRQSMSAPQSRDTSVVPPPANHNAHPSSASHLAHQPYSLPSTSPSSPPPPPQPPLQPPEMRSSPMPPSEPVQSEGTTEGYDDYNIEYQRQPGLGKQLYVTMPPPKARRQSQLGYNWSPHPQSDNGDAWNDLQHPEYCYSESENDLDEGEEDDSNSWQC